MFINYNMIKIKDLDLDLEISEWNTIVATHNWFQWQVITYWWYTTATIRSSWQTYRAWPKLWWYTFYE